MRTMSDGTGSDGIPSDDRPDLFRCREEIDALFAAFQDTSLPFAQWTHAAHLTVALCFLREDNLPEATDRIRDGIRKYNAAHGIVMTKDRGYHETLTLFWTRLVYNYLCAASDKQDLVALANGLVRTCCDAKLPLRYYTRERLISWEARTGWVAPDLEALP